MNMNEYLEQSSRTSTGDYILTRIGLSEIIACFDMSDEGLRAMDFVRKQIFYARSPTGYKGEPLDREGFLAQSGGLDPDYVHGILGVATEAKELCDLLENAIINNEPIEPAKLADEAGDILWFLAIMFRRAGLSFEEVAEKNIQKLAVRYPDKFDSERAVNKNSAEESKVFST